VERLETVAVVNAAEATARKIATALLSVSEMADAVHGNHAEGDRAGARWRLVHGTGTRGAGDPCNGLPEGIPPPVGGAGSGFYPEREASTDRCLALVLPADLPFGAVVVDLTAVWNCRENATDGRIAGVGSARIVVVAGDGRVGAAGCGNARICRAQVGVVASDGRVSATGCDVAGVGRAQTLVVARLRRTRHARVVRADVARGAGVVVAAGLAVAVRVRAVRVAVEVPVHAVVADALDGITPTVGVGILTLGADAVVHLRIGWRKTAERVFPVRPVCLAGNRKESGGRRSAVRVLHTAVRNCRVLATQDRVAGVRGAVVAVVTVERRAWHARAACARVAVGAQIVVRALVDVVDVLAPCQCVAGVVGTEVVVVAVGRDTRDTAGGLVAGLNAVARVLVVADNRRVNAQASLRVAEIKRAGVAVVAECGREDAAGCGNARVHGAGVEVVADNGRVNATSDRVARVGRALVTVVAGLGREDAAEPRVARVGRAKTLVVAALRRARDACAIRADVVVRAEVVVLAVRGVGCVVTTGERLARVVGARVEVVAVDDKSDACAVGTGVGVRALVPVVAGCIVVLVDTAECRVARVIGARVVVVAVQRRTLATAVHTGVRGSAGVLVVARLLVVALVREELLVAVVVHAVKDFNGARVDTRSADRVLLVRAVESAVRTDGWVVSNHEVAVALALQCGSVGGNALLLGTLAGSILTGLLDRTSEIATRGAEIGVAVAIEIQVAIDRERVVGGRPTTALDRRRRLLHATEVEHENAQNEQEQTALISRLH